MTTVSMQDRYHSIMVALKAKPEEHLTAKQICQSYLREHTTTSDIGSTNQILNVLALAGVVEKIKVQTSAKMFRSAYKLVRQTYTGPMGRTSAFGDGE